MNKTLAIAVLVVGIVLLLWGWEAHRSFGSRLSRSITGSSSNRAMNLTISGIIVTAIGAYGVMQSRKGP